YDRRVSLAPDRQRRIRPGARFHGDAQREIGRSPPPPERLGHDRNGVSVGRGGETQLPGDPVDIPSSLRETRRFVGALAAAVHHPPLSVDGEKLLVPDRKSVV